MLRKKYISPNIQRTTIVLPSHYHRITIVLPSYTNARVIQAICLVGVNSYPVTSKIFRFTGPLRKGLKSSTFALTFVSDGHTNAMRSDEDSLRRHRALLGSTEHRNNSTQCLCFREKTIAFFWRNVTRCYAKNIIAIALPSYYHRTQMLV